VVFIHKNRRATAPGSFGLWGPTIIKERWPTLGRPESKGPMEVGASVSEMKFTLLILRKRTTQGIDRVDWVKRKIEGIG